MPAEPSNGYTKSVYIGIFLILAAISLYVIWPFLTSIFGGFILAYLFFPVYKKILEKTRNKTISALLMLLIVLVVIIVPSAIITNVLAKEAITLYVFAKQKIVGGSFFDINCELEQYMSSPVCKFNEYTKDIVRDPRIGFYLESGLSKVTQYIFEKTTGFFIALPKLLLSLFIAIFMMYYLWKDWDRVLRKIHKVFHLKKHHENLVYQKVKDMTYAIVYGNLIVALIQGAIGAFGFFIFGVSSPITWGIVMAFLSLLHFVGTPLIWVPAALGLLVEGLIQSNNSLIFSGVGLFLYGVIIISTVDNFLRPKIIGSRADIHPTLVILGIFGGIAAFGFMGLVLGPLILGITNIFIDIYEEEIKS